MDFLGLSRTHTGHSLFSLAISLYRSHRISVCYLAIHLVVDYHPPPGTLIVNSLNSSTVLGFGPRHIVWGFELSQAVLDNFDCLACRVCDALWHEVAHAVARGVGEHVHEYQLQISLAPH